MTTLASNDPQLGQLFMAQWWGPFYGLCRGEAGRNDIHPHHQSSDMSHREDGKTLLVAFLLLRCRGTLLWRALRSASVELVRLQMTLQVREPGGTSHS